MPCTRTDRIPLVDARGTCLESDLLHEFLMITGVKGRCPTLLPDEGRFDQQHGTVSKK